MVHTNDVYHKLVEDRAWLANKSFVTWYITLHVKWCNKVLDTRWQTHLPFLCKGHSSACNYHGVVFGGDFKRKT